MLCIRVFLLFVCGYCCFGASDARVFKPSDHSNPPEKPSTRPPSTPDDGLRVIFIRPEASWESIPAERFPKQARPTTTTQRPTTVSGTLQKSHTHPLLASSWESQSDGQLPSEMKPKQNRPTTRPAPNKI